MGELVLETLGLVIVRHGGQVRSFRTRKSLALLLYLTVEGGLHTREQLASFFWPESDAEHGRALLRRNVAFLRQTLHEAGEPAAQAHLLVERDTLGFNNRADFSLDLHILDAALAAGRATIQHRGADVRSASAAADPPDLLDRLQLAADAYRGDFLADFLLGDTPDFDDWSARQREHWHESIVTILDRLSLLQAEAGESADR